MSSNILSADTENEPLKTSDTHADENRARNDFRYQLVTAYVSDYCYDPSVFLHIYFT